LYFGFKTYLKEVQTAVSEVWPKARFDSTLYHFQQTLEIFLERIEIITLLREKGSTFHRAIMTLLAGAHLKNMRRVLDVVFDLFDQMTDPAHRLYTDKYAESAEEISGIASKHIIIYLLTNTHFVKF